MQNLKNINGTFKGVIGECLFKSANWYVFLTRFHPKKLVLSKYSQFLTAEQASFLENNWYSLDAIEYSFNSKKMVLYEVKTRNDSALSIGYKPKASASSIAIYNQAISLGFIVRSASVILYNNWEFSIYVSNYSPNNYCIDKPKKYDKVV